MIRRPPRSTLDRSSAASDVYKRQIWGDPQRYRDTYWSHYEGRYFAGDGAKVDDDGYLLSLIHISEPTRPY